MNYHPRAEFWSMFAAAALSRQMTVTLAAKEADAMLKQFDERWVWYQGGYGTFWKERERHPVTGKVKP